MTTIKKHAKRLCTQYEPDSERKEKLASAKHLAMLVLNDSMIVPELKKKVLKQLQWFISEVDHKYRTRFRSKQVFELAKNEPQSTVKINHEHVFTKKEITSKLLKDPIGLDTILDDVVGCVVTADEHKVLTALGSDCSGWERYKKAGIEVLDMANSPPTPIT